MACGGSAMARRGSAIPERFSGSAPRSFALTRASRGERLLGHCDGSLGYGDGSLGSRATRAPSESAVRFFAATRASRGERWPGYRDGSLGYGDGSLGSRATRALFGEHPTVLFL